jgi:lactoylglutathione lyase
MPVAFLHTRIRVADLDRSIDWYARTCGFVVLKRSDRSPAGNQIVHLELPGNAHTLELCYSPDYTVAVPEDLMHTCIGVDDIVSYCQGLADQGFEIWPANWKDKFTTGGMKMAFLTDPDGYELEILENRR